MTRGTHTRGMTLIELLVAISVATMVFAASVSLYLVITASLLHQQERRNEAGAAALDQIRHDLAGCAQAPFSNLPPFKVESPAHDTNAPGLCFLEFFVGSIPLPEDDFSKLEIHRIRYSVSGASVLMRESVSLWGTDALGPATSNGVLEGVTAWEVSVLTESGWTNQWASSARRLFPQAARLRLDWRAASTTETATVEVFIPAGNSTGI
jgi:type II secretion system protein J